MHHDGTRQHCPLQCVRPQRLQSFLSAPLQDEVFESHPPPHTSSQLRHYDFYTIIPKPSKSGTKSRPSHTLSQQRESLEMMEIILPDPDSSRRWTQACRRRDGKRASPSCSSGTSTLLGGLKTPSSRTVSCMLIRSSSLPRLPGSRACGLTSPGFGATSSRGWGIGKRESRRHMPHPRY